MNEVLTEQVHKIAKLSIANLKLEAIDRDKKSLKNVDALAENMRVLGQISPIVVFEDLHEDGKFRIVAGKRRTLAAKKLGWDSINAVVLPKDKMNTEGDFVGRVISDNLCHEPAEAFLQAKAFKQLLDDGIYKNQTELAKSVGLSQSSVSKILKLNELSDELKEQVSAGAVPITEVRKTKKKALKAPTEELVKSIKKSQFRMLPAEALIPSDGGNPVAFKVQVSATEARFLFSFPVTTLAATSIIEQIQKEISRVGDEDLVRSIQKFQKVEVPNESTEGSNSPQEAIPEGLEA